VGTGPSAAIREISGSDDLDDLIRSANRGVVVEFWGTWCRPCRVLRPHLQRLAGDHAGEWRFAAVHADKHPDLVKEWSVMATPTLIYLRQGKERHRTSGAVTPSMIEETLTSVT
jgi:thioredoxin-like negative regulator of GroEL